MNDNHSIMRHHSKMVYSIIGQWGGGGDMRGGKTGHTNLIKNKAIFFFFCTLNAISVRVSV